MNKIAREICMQAGRFIGVNRLLKIKKPLFLPFYHVVSDEKLPHILNYKYRNTAQFERELDFYLKHFKPVGLKDLANGNYPDNAFHLSFDDGLRECAEVIAPILLRKGIQATFFVNPGFADNLKLFHKYKASLILNHLKLSPDFKAEQILKSHNLNGDKILKSTILHEKVLDEAAVLIGLNFSDFLLKQKPYLTTSQLLNLQNQGFSVGAHSYNHPEFWKISEQEQMDEIQNSMNWLVEKLNPALKAFSFPFTDSGVSLKVLKSLKNADICDITFGTAGIKFDELEHHFQRYPVEQSGDFLSNLKGELVYLELRNKIGKSIVKH